MKITLAFLLLSLSCCFTLPVDKKDEPAAPVPKPIAKPEPKVPETQPKPVPKQPQPVPKQPQPVPKQPQPVPKQPQPVPKQPQPVPNQPQPVPNQPQPVPNQPQPAPKPVPKIDCLVQLLKKDAPALLSNLGTLLCNYKVAQRQQNVAFFISFLEQVDNILKEVGCSLSNLLGTSVIPDFSCIPYTLAFVQYKAAKDTIDAQDASEVANAVSLILFNFLQEIIERVMKVLEDIPIIGDLINDVPLTQDVRDLGCSVLNHYLTKIAHILTIIGEVTGGLTHIIEGL